MKKIQFLFIVISIISCRDNNTIKNKKNIIFKQDKLIISNTKKILTITNDTIHLPLTESYDILNLDSITENSKKIKAKYYYSHKSILNKKLIESLRKYENLDDIKKITSALRLIQKKDTFSVDIRQNVKFPTNVKKNSVLIFNLSVYTFYYDNTKSNYILINNIKKEKDIN